MADPVAITLRLPAGLLARIDAAARGSLRSRNAEIVFALRVYLDGVRHPDPGSAAPGREGDPGVVRRVLRERHGRAAARWVAQRAGVAERTARRWLSAPSPPARLVALVTDDSGTDGAR